MATEIQPEKPLELMMKNLKVDPSSEISNGNLAAPKDGIPYDATSCISSSGDATSSIKGSDVDQDSLMAEQVMYYPSGGVYGYYYPGLNGSIGEWDAQGQYLGGNGLEIQYPVIQADNSPVFYYPPGVQLAYNSYNPYFPNAMIGMDGQYFCQQPLPPSPVFPQPVPSPGYYPSPVLHGSDAFPVYQWDGYPLYGDVAHGNGLGVGGVGSTVPTAKPKVSSLTNTLASAKFSPPKSGISVEKDTSPVLDLPPNNKPLKPANKVSQHGSGFPAATVLAKGYFPIPKCQEKEASLRFPNNSMNLKSNARDWMGSEKLKARGKANVVSDFDLYNEQNRGPRTSGAKNALVSAVDQVESVGNGTGNSLTTTIIKDHYNLPDFPTKYDHALFYVIKSYSEDDIHKSIKYNVWASTSNGNKRLDGAYQDAQHKREEKGCNCPVFLFFSVNASGQFCGVAEMIGRVDFNKSMDFWQQDKWNGFFPVKWHIIKDVPNPQFRHIILENNDNKPVTNSRDTQEVKFLQGIEILNIFKNYSAKTSILDDFGFYEGRQKAMQDKRIRPLAPRVEHSQKKPEEGVVQVVDAVSDLKSVVVASDNTTTEFATGHKKEVEVVSGVEE